MKKNLNSILSTTVMFIFLLSSVTALAQTPLDSPKPNFWFFSQDPSAAIFNPDPGDPNWSALGDDTKWTTDGILLKKDWSGTSVSYDFWLASFGADAAGVNLVVFANDAVSNWDVYVSINGAAETGPLPWTTSINTIISNHDPNKDPSTTDTYGFSVVSLPDLDGKAIGEACVPVQITLRVDLKSGGTATKLYLHLDAYSTDPVATGPNSHDATAQLNIPTVEKGTIIVEKQTTPDADSQSFTFSGDASGSIKDGEQIVVSGLDPGTYTSQETVPAGWTLTSISVDDGDSTWDLNTETVTFNLQAGETIKAVFTNTKDPVSDPWEAKIKARKVDENGDPIEGWMISLFQIDKYTDSDGYVEFTVVEPKTYTLSEETKPGWIALGDTIVEITVTEEETYTHTFRNQKVPDFVIPEYPLGTIMSIITMVTALIYSQNKHKIHL